MREITQVFEIETKRKFECLLHLPEKYEQEERSYPLLIFFHGGGERGNSIQDIKRFGIYQYIEELDLPCIILSMQCQENRLWDYHFPELNELIETSIGQYRIDKNKFIAMGFSLGGCAAMHYGILRPDLVRGVVSIAGAAFLKSGLKRLANTSVLLVHGTDDKRSPITSSEAIFEQLLKYGGDVTFVRREGAGHEICSTIFGEGVVYEWLEERYLGGG